ncbi:MAG: outer membrane beta-barrel protein, partial [Nitrospinaceae bacterium]|nr:outer membrane beta-barrel protein [Nitrospinaceae bacterium]
VLNWAGGNTAGNTNGNTVDLAWANFWDSVIDIELNDKTLLQLNIDYANREGTSNTVVGGDSNWWGASGILRHDCNDWFSMNLRGEFFSDIHGTQTSVGANFNQTAGQQLFSLTITPEFRISQNLLFRVEYRHDDSTRFAFMDRNNNQLNSSQDTISANALFHF